MIIIVPFLIKQIGSENFGKLEFAKSVAYYFTILINFGFNYTSTQRIAVARSDQKTLNKIFVSTYICKIGLILITIPLLLLVLNSFEILGRNKIVFVGFWLLSIMSGLVPGFIYQGLNKMHNMVAIDLFFRSIFVVFIFLSIKSSEDMWMYPFGYVIADGLRCVLGVLWLIYRYKFRVVSIDWSYTFGLFRESFFVFGSSLSRTIYDKFPQIIIGTTLGAGSVAVYVVSTKIIGELYILIYQISQAMFPVVAKRAIKDIRGAIIFCKKILLVAIPAILFVLAVIYVNSEMIVEKLSAKRVVGGAEILRCCIVLPLVVFIYTFAANSFLIPTGNSKNYSKIVLSVSIVSMTVLYLFRYGLSLLNICQVLVCAEILTCCVILVYAFSIVSKKLSKAE